MSISVWETTAKQLDVIYSANPDTARKQLKNQPVLLVLDDFNHVFYPVRRLADGIEGRDMTASRSEAQEVLRYAPDLRTSGFEEIREGEEHAHRLKQLSDLLEEKFHSLPSPSLKVFWVRDARPNRMAHVTEAVRAADEAQARAFQDQVAAAVADPVDVRRKRLTEADPTPKRVLRVVEAFRRNPDVVAERLSIANGICEECGSSAPFRRASNGMPFLEVHHCNSLANGGLDTVENTRALCPNCHREVHYG